MPEYPDLTVYVEALEKRIAGQPLEKLRIQSPSLLKSVAPPPTAVEGRPVRGIARMGKRLVFEFDDELYLVLHLMVAGRLYWKKRLSEECGDDFPEKITAFRPEMAVHGKFRAPCPVCETPVQRTVRAENEMNYCPECQTGDEILADRALSKLLGKDWPRRIEELEKRRTGSA